MVWNLEEQYLKVRNKSTFQLLEKQCVETDVIFAFVAYISGGSLV